MGQISNGVFEELHVNLDNPMWIKANINSEAIMGRLAYLLVGHIWSLFSFYLRKLTVSQAVATGETSKRCSRKTVRVDITEKVYCNYIHTKYMYRVHIPKSIKLSKKINYVYISTIYIYSYV